MQKQIRTGSGATKLGTNGSAHRQCPSWIEAFIEYTEFLETAPLFRKWVAIATIGAALERRVWINTGRVLYPNLYTFLIGKAGIGKTAGIDIATDILREVPDFHLSPTSMSRASLVDSLAECKRSIVMLPNPMVEYNTMFVAVDELSALMHQWDTDLVSALTKFYDCNAFSEAKRKETLRHKLDRPQLSVLCGTTPSNLMDLVPATAWGQGFMSRVILIYSNEKSFRNILDVSRIGSTDVLVHDIKLIGANYGEIKWNPAFNRLLHEWRESGCRPIPQHPRLADYCSRRVAHLLKLSMIACVDLGDKLVLTETHFRLALGWLLEAELNMGEIFSAGSTTVDARAMEEIEDFIRRAGAPVPHHQLVHQAARIVPTHAVLKIIELLWLSGRVKKNEANQYLLND